VTLPTPDPNADSGWPDGPPDYFVDDDGRRCWPDGSRDDELGRRAWPPPEDAMNRSRTPDAGGLPPGIDLSPEPVRVALAAALRGRGPDAALGDVLTAAARILDPWCRPEVLRAVRIEMFAAMDRAFGPQTCAARLRRTLGLCQRGGTVPIGGLWYCDQHAREHRR
jgi:hypothetical protein